MDTKRWNAKPGSSLHAGRRDAYDAPHRGIENKDDRHWAFPIHGLSLTLVFILVYSTGMFDNFGGSFNRANGYWKKEMTQKSKR